MYAQGCHEGLLEPLTLTPTQESPIDLNACFGLWKRTLADIGRICKLITKSNTFIKQDKTREMYCIALPRRCEVQQSSKANNKTKCVGYFLLITVVLF